jgi:hypothetical protein
MEVYQFTTTALDVSSQLLGNLWGKKYQWNRVANEIPFQNNSGEYTLNGFRYSAEKIAPFAQFRVSRNSPF